ncbi:MAG: polysaccharide biosynthesis C-terminal domain-containing protein, partial [Ferruginibacter sp.]
ITIAGAIVTILLNIWWIPHFGYTGSAWATFSCYAFMMIVSYLFGQKLYPIPYAKKKLAAYLVLTTLIFFLHKALVFAFGNIYFSVGTAFILLLAFLWFVARVERKEFAQFPIVGKFFNPFSPKA